MCGEKIFVGATLTMAEGSPPRVRGKDVRDRAVAITAGITPACAGKSARSRRFVGCQRDHPRVCGEKGKPLKLERWEKGSPPRVRGKVVFVFSSIVFDGITPACAGKSMSASSIARSCRDHPRVCGEKRGRRTKKDGGVGSPPRVRGKDLAVVLFAEPCRITPACAGKSRSGGGELGDCQDHPRVCGEKVVDTAVAARRTRITPACAGKS